MSRGETEAAFSWPADASVVTPASLSDRHRRSRNPNLEANAGSVARESNQEPFKP